MRPILTLKKKPSPALADTVSPAAQPAEPVKATEPAQPAKPSPKEVKEARAAANRLVNEELRARRLADTERLRPLVEAYVASQPLFQETVLVDGVECFRPLVIGLHKTILAQLRLQPETQGCSHAVLYDLLRAVLKPHVSSSRYLAGILRLQDRFDLDGNAIGIVEDKHQAGAAKRLRKLDRRAANPA